MKTRTFAEALLNDACFENVAFYRQMIEQEPVDAIKDDLWRKIVTLARSLPVEDRETLLAFSHQAAIDAISTVCGGIDGTTQLGGQFATLSLIDGDGQQHAGAKGRK
ncbi:MAG: hypothetical protein U1F55_00705 [Chitinivorax sp.]